MPKERSYFVEDVISVLVEMGYAIDSQTRFGTTLTADVRGTVSPPVFIPAAPDQLPVETIAYALQDALFSRDEFWRELDAFVAQ